MPQQKDWPALEELSATSTNHLHLQEAGFSVWNYTGDITPDFTMRCTDLHQAVIEMQAKLVTLLQHVPVINAQAHDQGEAV